MTPPHLLGRGLSSSGEGSAMDAKEFFAQQETAAREIQQQLEKELPCEPRSP